MLLEHADICLAVANDAVRSLTHIANQFQDDVRSYGFTVVGAERVEALLQMIETVSQKSIPPTMFMQLIPLQREVAFTLTAVRQHNRAGDTPSGEREKKARKRADAVVKCRDALQQIRDDLAKAYRAH
ncbi:hypothetical protein CEJ42_16950 [Herbaspirillum robiniae]|uniref:Uncharacterized protein n=1 Tax=Herbaspirillum robiniae TaxID=2014887 RepID=A0A246WQ99_9BURK|nr:hypothetical protein CEJ42_16950 [Herbaspirillum robiniae]